MDLVARELDYGVEDCKGAKKIQYQESGAIPALAEDELIGEDDEYEDLYNDVNVGEGIFQFNQTGASGSSSSFGHNGLQVQQLSALEPRTKQDVQCDLGHAGVKMDMYQNVGTSVNEQKAEVGYVDHLRVSLMGNVSHGPPLGNMGFQAPNPTDQSNVSRGTNPCNGVLKTIPDLSKTQIEATINESIKHTKGSDNMLRPLVDVGELHWWTTDVELEDALSQYGRVKDIKFFDERASGKSKGYCQVEFYEPTAAAACKERMNGYVFNGRACVVAFASPQTLNQMGAASTTKIQTQPLSQPQVRRLTNDGAGRGGGINYLAGDGGRNYGRCSWGRGQGGFNSGPGIGGPRERRQLAAKKSILNPSSIGNGVFASNYGQGLHAFGGSGNRMMHPQAMIGPGFDPTFMGRRANYGSYSDHAFPRMMPQFQTINTMGISVVAPHVNPAFFGCGMAPNGMGMLGANGMDEHPGLMWSDLSMGGWAREEHAQRTKDSSYCGDDGASGYGVGEANPEKGARSNSTSHEEERSSHRDWLGNSDRRNHVKSEHDLDISERFNRSHMKKEDKDEYQDHRTKDCQVGNIEDDWDKGTTSSRSRSRSRVVPDDDYRSHSRDADYGKRKRVLE